MTLPSLRTVVLITCCVVCLSGNARAQHGTGAEEADRLFAEGLQLMESDRFGEAIPLLERSQSLDASTATLLNLAKCYARNGKLATAWRLYRNAADAAKLEDDDSLLSVAESAMANLEPTLTRLHLVSSVRPDKVAVTDNGEPVDSRSPIPLDPGKHIIEVNVPGRPPWRTLVNARERGGVVVVELRGLEAGSPVTPSPPSPPLRENHRRRDTRIAGGAAFGIGAACLGVAGVMAVRAQAVYRDSEAHCSGGRCNPTGRELRDTAYDRANVATWTMGAGVAAVAAGAVLWLLPRREQRQGGIVVRPWAAEYRQPFGISVAGDF